MTAVHNVREHRSRVGQPEPTRLSLLLPALLIPFLVGCDGCRSREEAETTSQEIKKPPYLAEPIQTFPSTDTRPIGIKPAHWITASQRLKSTRDDVRGQMISRVDPVRSQSSVKSSQPESIRSVLLPKGQWRHINYRVLPPGAIGETGNRYVLKNQLTISGQPVGVANTNRAVQRSEILKPHEYFFVILTSRPDRFNRLQTADWVRFQPEGIRHQQSENNFRVITISDQSDLLPLPDTMLDWTATAIVLWDDLPPSAITPRQQRALADWIHFGGLLIVNGAVASENLSFSALANLLPMQLDSVVELDTAKAQTLLKSWSVNKDSSLDQQLAILSTQAGGISFSGTLHRDAKHISSSGELLVHRSLGGGNVLQSRFDLTSDWVANWESYDSFFNGVILGRPHRAIRITKDELDDRLVTQHYPQFSTSNSDAAFNTNFRIASRDAALSVPFQESRTGTAQPSTYDSDTLVEAQAGISGWHNESDFIRIATEILRKESGIRIPESKSALSSLLVYLIVLIPVNYLIFRSLSRLEWFWLAVPVISIAGGVVIAKVTQLDIGFSRSGKELALLEIQTGYDRAHLTRLVSVYNSLSTDYQIDFDSNDVAVEPLDLRAGRDDESQYDTGTFDFSRSDQPRISGFQIDSNQARMIRAEQMVDLEGVITLSDDNWISNSTKLDFFDGYAVRRASDGLIQTAPIENLNSGEQKQIQFLHSTEMERSGEMSVELEGLLNSLNSEERIQEGMVCLVARCDGSLNGISMAPNLDQYTGQTLVIIHLRTKPSPEPKKDLNLVSEFRERLDDENGLSSSGEATENVQ